MIIVLHNIRSMHNVGAIFRTADAAGCKKIYLCGITPSPLNEFKKPRQQITKVSLGAEDYIEWEKAGRTHALLDKLKKDGYRILALEQNEKSVPYNKVKISKKELDNTVLVVGHEVKGLSDAILKRADDIIEIPMAGKKESLNVSIAFGIVVFSLRYNNN